MPKQIVKVNDKELDFCDFVIVWLEKGLIYKISRTGLLMPKSESETNAEKKDVKIKIISCRKGSFLRLYVKDGKGGLIHIQSEEKIQKITKRKKKRKT